MLLSITIVALGVGCRKSQDDLRSLPLVAVWLRLIGRDPAAALLLLLQERLTCQEAMAHPYFAPVRQREGFDVQGNRVAAPVAAGAGGT